MTRGAPARAAADRIGIVSFEETAVPVRRFRLSLLVLAGLAWAAPALAAEDFTAWLQGLRQEALADGIRPATLDRALEIGRAHV